jgi:hypothetical protein
MLPLQLQRACHLYSTEAVNARGVIASRQAWDRYRRCNNEPSTKAAKHNALESRKCLFDQMRTVVLAPLRMQAFASSLRLHVKGDNGDILVMFSEAFGSSLDSRVQRSLKQKVLSVKWALNDAGSFWCESGHWRGDW